MLKIGLIGGGHFGSALKQRFEETGFEAELLVSRGRGTNFELVEAADVLLLCVRPQQLAALCEELRAPLQQCESELCIVTFSAATSAPALAAALGKPVLRAMADLQFDQVLSFAEDRIRPLFSALSKNPLIEVQNEILLEDFTILMACLSGVAAWQYWHNPEGADAWLAEYCRFIQKRLGVPLALAKKICASTKLEEDPADLIARMATPGGITESLVQALDANPELSFEELYEAGRQRSGTLRAAVAASLEGKKLEL